MRLLQRKIVATASAKFDISLYERAGKAGFFAQLLRTDVDSPGTAGGVRPAGLVESTITAGGLADLEAKCRASIVAAAGPIVSDTAARPRAAGDAA